MAVCLNMGVIWLFITWKKVCKFMICSNAQLFIILG
ncbi:hypothetical protein SLEP1_g50932 [Rubroshorea leprosula]|uniref:Uncharacterized protein n=1 Tax=Rubroshorea leprosula TaxID=152421 RepID=A0AAV5M407_9ROSI|nr:hypothetical protein SLEP1_g50932 [Rubroshorea leprosula]